jgi:hypothetical protein
MGSFASFGPRAGHFRLSPAGSATLTPTTPKPTAVYEYKDQDTVVLNVRVQRSF